MMAGGLGAYRGGPPRWFVQLNRVHPHRMKAPRRLLGAFGVWPHGAYGLKLPRRSKLSA